MDLTADALGAVLADAEFFLSLFGLRLDEPPSAAVLSVRVTGRMPRMTESIRDAHTKPVEGEDVVFVRPGMSFARARLQTFHELAEIYHQRRGYQGTDVEARCNAMAAALAAPKRAVLTAVERYGHSVYDLALALKTPQSAMVLRLAECVGRPCALLRQAYPIVRGRPFAWPETPAGFHSLIGARRTDVHPLRIADEPAPRWAFMAVA